MGAPGFLRFINYRKRDMIGIESMHTAEHTIKYTRDI